MNIREWYLETFPTDELGLEVSESATFEGLSDVLNNGEDVYEYIGVGDSLIRERLFEKLAETIHSSYDYVYNLWLN